MKNNFAILLLFLSAKTFAQNYAVSTISADLKENAHAVIRNSEEEFIVKNIGEAVKKVKAAITIFDEKGDDFAQIGLGYDKYTKINDLEAVIYNEAGKQVKKLKRSDIETYKSSGSNLTTDNFVRVFKLSYNVYPYTIAYSYEITEKNMMFYPTWEAINDNSEGTAVEKSSLLISMPQGLELRFKEQNMPTKAQIYSDAERKVWSWKVENLKAVELEPNSPKESRLMPMVFTAPTEFKIDDYVGKFNSWNDFGIFQNTLNKNRNKLPEALVSQLKDLVKNESTTEAKVKKMYEFLQANTRYVSIQLGIGGWQPMLASEVSSKGYGDCKALSNLMKTLLEEIGIKAHYTLVRAGDNESDIFPEFPSSQFNHVIVCVPNQKDTLWLECTSQTLPFGYLSGFTSDRHVLLITDDGGKLVKTPSYKAADNQQVRSAKVVLNETGEANADVTTRYFGEQQDLISQVIHQLGKDDQKKFLLKNLDLPSVEISDFSWTEMKAKIPSVTEKLKLSLRNVSTKTGSRLFVSPNLFNQHRNIPVPNVHRKNDFVQPMNYTDIDTVSIQIPKNYVAEFLPETAKIQSKYGIYTANVLMKDDKILYIRQLTINKGQFPASEYAQWVDFRKKIAKADKNQMVLAGK